MLQATLNEFLCAAMQGERELAALNAHSSQMSLRDLRNKSILPPKEHRTHQATSRRSLICKTSRVCANDTGRPSTQRSSLTKPSAGAVTATSIFIDSMTTRV